MTGPLPYRRADRGKRYRGQRFFPFFFCAEAATISRKGPQHSRLRAFVYVSSPACGLKLSAGCYLATLSSHLTMQNITAIEMKQTMAKTLHVADREML